MLRPKQPFSVAENKPLNSSGNNNETPYSSLKEIQPHLHKQISQSLNRDKASQSFKILKNHPLDLDTIAKEKKILAGSIKDLRKIDFRTHDQLLKEIVENFISDVAKLRENLENIYDFSRRLSDGKTRGESEALMELAINQAAQDITILLARIEDFKIRGRADIFLSDLAKRFSQSLIVLSAALGIGLFYPTGADQESLNYKITAAAEQTTVGQMALKQQNNLIRRKSVNTPDMRGNSKEKKEMAAPHPLAIIEGDLPQFFVTGAYQIGINGEREYLRERQINWINQTDKPEGTITIPENNYKKNQEIILPLPIGYGISDISVQPVAAQALQPNSIIFLENTKRPVEIKYNIVKIDTELYDLAVANREVTPLTKEAAELRQRIEEKPYQLSQNFSRYLRNFIYITSDDLQDLLDRLPETAEQKTELLKLGDCDLLSDHIAHIIGDRIPAGVAEGFDDNNNDKKLTEDEGHARLIYTDHRGIFRDFETTSYVKAAYENLQFLPEDRRLLEEKIETIGKITAPEQRLDAYSELRKTLFSLLQKKDYHHFKPKIDFIDALKNLFNQSDILTELKGWGIENFEEINNSDSSTLLMIALAIIFEGAPVSWWMMRGAKKHKQKVRLKDLENEASLINRTADSTNNRTPKKIYVEAGFRQLCEELNADPLKEPFINLTTKEKEVLLMLDQLKDSFTTDFIIPYALSRRRFYKGCLKFQRKLEQMSQACGDTDDKLKNLVRSVYNSERIQKGLEREKGQTVESIIEQGKQYLADLTNNDGISAISSLLDRENIPLTSSRLRGRLAGQGKEEFYEHRDYSPFDDLKTVDWKASARSDKIKIKELRGETKDSKKRNYYFVVDLPSVNDCQLALFHNFLIIASRDRRINIQGMDLYAFGKLIRRFDHASFEKIFQGRTKTGAYIKDLINLLVSGRIKEGFNVATSDYLINSRSSDFLEVSLPKNFPRDGAAVVMGARNNLLLDFDGKGGYRYRFHEIK